MEYLSYLGVQVAMMLSLAPLVNGIIKKIKAFSQKRQGPPIFQLYYDLAKLIRKDTVSSETASWLFKLTPYLYFTATVTASLFIPVSSRLVPAGPLGDAILGIYLLALARFFMALAGLDTGSTFGGMGSSREMMISSLVEPSILISLVTLGLICGSTSFAAMITYSATAGFVLLQPVFFLIFASLLLVLMAETARIPVDDPATHLELTMVHEAMLLEYSGRHLALMEWGASIKQLILIALLANLFLPMDALLNGVNPLIAIWISLGFFLIKVVFLSVVVAVIEINTVKFRLFSVPNLAALSFILSFLGFFLNFVLGR